MRPIHVLLPLCLLAIPLPAQEPSLRETPRPSDGARFTAPEPVATHVHRHLLTGAAGEETPYFLQRWLQRRLGALEGVAWARIEEQTTSVLTDSADDDVDSPEGASVAWLRRTNREEPAFTAIARERWLTVGGDADGIERARALLRRHARAPRPPILFEAIFISSDRASDDEGPVLELLTPQELERVLAAARDGGLETIVSSPSILVRAGESAEVSTVSRLSYVNDFEISAKDGTFIAEPVIGTVEEGIEIRLGAVVDPETHRIEITAAVTIAQLERPIRKHTITIADQELTVELPEVRSTSAGWDRIVLEPRHRAFSLRQTTPDGKSLLTLVKVTLRPEGEAAPPLARIVGVDRDARRVFAMRTRPASSDPAPSPRPDARGGDGLPLLNDVPIIGQLFARAKEVEIARPESGESVGRARVLSVEGDLLILELLSGTARAGDVLR